MTSHASQQIIDEISAQLAGGLELNFTSAHARKIYEISTELATHGTRLLAQSAGNTQVLKLKISLDDAARFAARAEDFIAQKNASPNPAEHNFDYMINQQFDYVKKFLVKAHENLTALTTAA